MTGRLGRALRSMVAVGSVVLTLGLAASGCGGKKTGPSGPPPEITGLAAVPASAEAVVGADIAKLADSPVIDRVVEQLLLRNSVLAERWGHLRDDCKIDLARQVKHIMVALGPHAGPAPGTGPVIMVVVGAIPETDLKECVTRLVGGGGGTLTGTTVSGRTLYLARDGNRKTYFAYGRPDTIVLGADEAYVTEALGGGPKASDNPDFARWLKLVDQRAAVWAVGRIDARVRDGLMKLTDGKLSGGPVALALTANLSSGANLQLGVVMANQEDAKSLGSFVKGEVALLTAAAQWKSLGSVVGKIAVTVSNEIVSFSAPLTIDDLNLLLSALDGGRTPAQDSAPPTPGSDSGPK